MNKKVIDLNTISMKVIYCLIDSSPAGGMERVICTKANYLAETMGYDVTIITTDKNNKPNFFEFSNKINFIDLGINYLELAKYSPIKKILKQIKKRKLHKQKLTEVIFSIKPDICISTFTHELTILSEIKDGSKKIAEIHFSKPYKEIEYRSEKSFFKRFFAIAGERNKHRFINKYDAFVVLTEEDKARWRGINNIRVIANPLPFAVDETSSCDKKRVISVGRLSLQKGYTHLIKAWKLVSEKHTDWKLCIYGQGEQKAELDNLIEKLKLQESVSIQPPVLNIKDEFLKNSIYAMSSIYEGFGLALAEAMLCGLPSVAFDCPSGPAEIITEGVDGFLVETGNYKILAERIVSLIENETLRKEMGQQAHKNMKRFLPENTMPRWVTLFEQISL